MNDRLCRSCGAPLKGGTHRCEYCGADWQPPPPSLSFNLQAVLALVLSLVAVPFLMIPWFGLIPAGVGLYFGIDALREMRRQPAPAGAKAMAIIGTVLCAMLLLVMAASLHLLYGQSY